MNLGIEDAHVFASLCDSRQQDHYHRLRRPVVEMVVRQIKCAMGRPRLNAAMTASGIEDFRWHDLRHTWASWLRQNEVPTWVLQELGGWKSETMVRRYAHMSVKHLQPYADQLIFPVTAGNGGNPGSAVSETGHKNGHSAPRFRLKLVVDNT